MVHTSHCCCGFESEPKQAACTLYSTSHQEELPPTYSSSRIEPPSVHRPVNFMMTRQKKSPIRETLPCQLWMNPTSIIPSRSISNSLYQTNHNRPSPKSLVLRCTLTTLHTLHAALACHHIDYRLLYGPSTCLIQPKPHHMLLHDHSSITGPPIQLCVLAYQELASSRSLCRHRSCLSYTVSTTEDQRPSNTFNLPSVIQAPHIRGHLSSKTETERTTRLPQTRVHTRVLLNSRNCSQVWLELTLAVLNVRAVGVK